MNQIYMADMAVQCSQQVADRLRKSFGALNLDQQQAVAGVKQKAREAWKDSVDREFGNVTGEPCQRAPIDFSY